jgi:rubrerythrin
MSPVDALQRALAAEHAALHVYGTLGARTSASATPQLYTDISAGYDEHRVSRDLLTSLVRDHGAEPVAAEPAYALPARLDTPDAVTREALEIERRCEGTYAWVVEQTSGSDRRLAITSLTSAAVRALAFRGSPEIFPGMAEYTDR